MTSAMMPPNIGPTGPILWPSPAQSNYLGGCQHYGPFVTVNVRCRIKTWTRRHHDFDNHPYGFLEVWPPVVGVVLGVPMIGIAESANRGDQFLAPETPKP